MSKRYLLFLSMCTVSFLCIVQLAILGKPNMGFFEYLGHSYTFSLTAGGILISLLTAPVIYLLDLLAGYIFFVLAFMISVALLVDYLYYLKKNIQLQNPFMIFSKKQKVAPATPEQKTASAINHQNLLAKFEKKEQVKLTLDAKLESEEKENQAKIKLGVIAGNMNHKPTMANPQNKYEYIMTPPQIDLAHYSKTRQTNEQRILQTFENLKNQNQTLASTSGESVLPQTENQAQIKPVYDDLPEFVIPPKPNFSPSKPFIAPTEDDEEKTISAENDRIDKILSDILDETKPIDVEPEPILPQSNRRRNFAQLAIDGVAKEQPKPTKHYTKPPAYTHPPLDLLKTNSVDLSSLNQDVIGKRIQLESALELFKIPAKVIGIVVGPAVTRYELEMPPGISVKKILAHSDDIALALAAKGDIRIEAPIPGKSAVGIEVPNDKIATVGIKEILSSPEFITSKAPLTFALGKDISGAIKICNLQKMPHLLVAGATNSGKSVCLNAIIISLVYKTSPEDLKLILIDPKRVEFAQYNALPHLLLPNVITEADMALNAFNWAIQEMERRFQLFMESRVRNLDEYNAQESVIKQEKEKLPFIVIIVDELADLLMVSKKDCEEKIMRLAQKARACGIHLILATQRPSVDIITGTIKANFPSRIAFAVTSFQDSRTILDQGGAEKLLGKGDMLYSPSDAAEPRRIQGCYVSTEEVESIVQYVKQNNETEFDAQITAEITAPKQTGFSVDEQKPKDNGYEPIFIEALKLVVETGQASISMLQRRLALGYPKAARLIDQMEQANYITASDGSKPRSVLLTPEQFEQMFGNIEQ
jgi:DNA segregation ATPase FtsK/SpoIIIE-like protein